MSKYIGFFVHLSISQFDELEEAIKYYQSVTQYVICYEISPKGIEHYHIITDMSIQDYTRLRANYFIKKWHLNGQVKKDKPAQYKKLSKVENFDKLLSYSLKDACDNPTDHIRLLNFTPECIENAIEKSFKKNDIFTKQEKLIQLVDKLPIHMKSANLEALDDYLIDIIIEFATEHKEVATRSNLTRYLTVLYQFSPKMNKVIGRKRCLKRIKYLLFN